MSPAAHIQDPWTLSAQLWPLSSGEIWQLHLIFFGWLGNLLALAAAGQLSCILSARLPHSQSTSNCQLRCTPFSRQHFCTMSTPLQLCLHYVSPAAVCQLGCILSAQQQSICSSIFCHAIHLLWQTSCKTSARKCKLLCNLSSWMQSVCSVMICQVGSSLLAQSVSWAVIL